MESSWLLPSLMLTRKAWILAKVCCSVSWSNEVRAWSQHLHFSAGTLLRALYCGEAAGGPFALHARSFGPCWLIRVNLFASVGMHFLHMGNSWLIKAWQAIGFSGPHLLHIDGSWFTEA